MNVPRKPKRGLKSPRMPERSVFYDRIVPLVLAILGMVMVGLIVFALGVLSGLIPWR